MLRAAPGIADTLIAIVLCARFTLRHTGAKTLCVAVDPGEPLPRGEPALIAGVVPPLPAVIVRSLPAPPLAAC